MSPPRLSCSHCAVFISGAWRIISYPSSDVIEPTPGVAFRKYSGTTFSGSRRFEIASLPQKHRQISAGLRWPLRCIGLSVPAWIRSAPASAPCPSSRVWIFDFCGLDRIPFCTGSPNAVDIHHGFWPGSFPLLQGLNTTCSIRYLLCVQSSLQPRFSLKLSVCLHRVVAPSGWSYC